MIMRASSGQPPRVASAALALHPPPRKTPLLLLLSISSHASHAFTPARSIAVSARQNCNGVEGTSANGRGSTITTTSLPASTIPTGDRPPPRRTLKKRKNKRRQRMNQLSRKIQGFDADVLHKADANLGVEEEDDVEIRPARRRDAVQVGLDYWIDEGDLERERQRKVAARNRKPMKAGAMPKERLREEVVAPYKQNWIGVFSVVVVVLSAIGTKFPELLQIPIIPIPDL